MNIVINKKLKKHCTYLWQYSHIYCCLIKFEFSQELIVVENTRIQFKVIFFLGKYLKISIIQDTNSTYVQNLCVPLPYYYCFWFLNSCIILYSCHQEYIFIIINYCLLFFFFLTYIIIHILNNGYWFMLYWTYT